MYFILEKVGSVFERWLNRLKAMKRDTDKINKMCFYQFLTEKTRLASFVKKKTKGKWSIFFLCVLKDRVRNPDWANIVEEWREGAALADYLLSPSPSFQSPPSKGVYTRTHTPLHYPPACSHMHSTSCCTHTHTPTPLARCVDCAHQRRRSSLLGHDSVRTDCLCVWVYMCVCVGVCVVSLGQAARVCV